MTREKTYSVYIYEQQSEREGRGKRRIDKRAHALDELICKMVTCILCESHLDNAEEYERVLAERALSMACHDVCAIRLARDRNRKILEKREAKEKMRLEKKRLERDGRDWPLNPVTLGFWVCLAQEPTNIPIHLRICV